MNRFSNYLGLILLGATLLPLGLLAQQYQYSLSWQNAGNHEYTLCLQTAPASGEYSDFQVPAWRPGRYYIQDYAAAVHGFSAVDAEGNALSWQKTDNDTWRVKNPAKGEIQVCYQAYANTMDAGSSVLNGAQAYFNPVNFFMHLRNEYSRPCTLEVKSMPQDWKAATSLGKVAGKHNVFTAADYHDLADAPTVLSPSLKTLEREIGSCKFYFHFQGEFKGGKDTEDAYLDNMTKMILEQRAIFGDFPMKEYHFIYQLLPYNMGHAVEHKYSSCYAMPNTVAASAAAIGRLNSISSHEFFHLWNVKRIRPAVMWPYDYQKEAYTRLHWFTEGVTDYYASLALARVNLYSQETFLGIMARTIQSLENNYAGQIVSCGQSSHDAWLERSNYKLPYGQISCYTLGTRAGLLLDLKIRALTGGKQSLDDVFVYLYKNYYQKDKGLEESAVLAAVNQVAGQSFEDFFAQHIEGTAKIDYASIFEPFGLELERKPIGKAEWQHVGIEKVQMVDEGIFIEQVRPESDAAKAGLAEQFLIFKINGKPAKEFEVEAFFEKFKRPKSMTISAASEGGFSEHNLTWTNTWVPENFKLLTKEKASAEAKALRDGWLKSKQ